LGSRWEWRGFILRGKDGYFPDKRFANGHSPDRRTKLAQLPLDGFSEILQ
jgi:hypothetical protein